jgi:hypothetical protein
VPGYPDGAALQETRLDATDGREPQKAIWLDAGDCRANLVSVRRDNHTRCSFWPRARGGEIAHMVHVHALGQGAKQIAEPGNDGLLGARGRVQRR